MKSKGTLEFALRPHRIDPSVLEERHAAVLGVIDIFLGLVPRHCRYLYIWPPAFETMSVLVPNLFNVPFCDFGFGPIEGDLRGLAAYVVSRGFGCSYCSAHCAGLGTVWRGSEVFLSKNAQAMVPVPDPTIFTSKELAIIAIGKKLGPIPSKVTTADIRDMAQVLTEEEQECVINAMALMGFLNRVMDTLGMTIELHALEVGNKYLAESGWTPGISFDPEADEELMEEDRSEMRRKAEREKSKFCGGFSYMKMMVGAKMADAASLKNTPSSEARVRQLCVVLAGFTPYYLAGEQRCKMPNARNALVWSFTLRLCHGSEEVPTAVKQMMCHVFATFAENTILRAHSAFMAHRNGVSIDTLASVAASCAGDGGHGLDDPKQAAAVSLAQACCATPGDVSADLVDLLMRLYSPPGILELIITLAVANMLHRWTAVYVPEEYEPEILEFVRENGAALSIDPTKPCTEEQSGWRAMAADFRRG